MENIILYQRCEKDESLTVGSTSEPRAVTGIKIPSSSHFSDDNIAEKSQTRWRIVSLAIKHAKKKK